MSCIYLFDQEKEHQLFEHFFKLFALIYLNLISKIVIFWLYFYFMNPRNMGNIHHNLISNLLSGNIVVDPVVVLFL